MKKFNKTKNNGSNANSRIPEILNDIINNNSLIMITNDFNEYRQVPLIDIFEDKLLQDSEQNIIICAYFENYLFGLGFYPKLTYDFVSHLIDVKEFLCFLPDWVNSICIMNTIEANNRLPGIFKLPQAVRNETLDKYFNDKRFQAKKADESNNGEKGIWIDMEVVNNLDTEKFPIIMISEAGEHIPLTKQEHESLIEKKGENLLEFLNEIREKRNIE